MMPKMLEATRAYEQRLDREVKRSEDRLLSGMSMLMSYELFEEKLNTFPYDSQTLNVFKAMYASVPTLRAQIEAKYGVDEPPSIQVDKEVASTLKAICRTTTNNSMNCYYDYYNGNYTLEFEFTAPNNKNYFIDLNTYMELEECRHWLSEKKEFDVKLVDVRGRELNDSLADFLYTNYYENLYTSKKDTYKPIIRDKTGFFVNMDAVNDRLIEMKYRPFIVPKTKYRVATLDEFREMEREMEMRDKEQDERDDI